MTLDPIYRLIGELLAIFYSLSHNFGLAIILLTCTVMALVYPLTAKQVRSMIAIQKVQPEIKRIQQKYKDDRQKQNEEMLKFYQENKINPLAGCLPLLLQMPIFISLFRVLHDIEKHIPRSGRFDRLYHDIHVVAPRGMFSVPRLLAEAQAGSGQSAWNALQSSLGRRAHAFSFLGMDLSESFNHARTTASALRLTPYLLVAMLVILTGWYQTRQTMARQGNAAAANPQMQAMTKVFPIAFGGFCLFVPSGVVVYWVVSNSWRIGQQALFLQKYYDDAGGAGDGKEPRVIEAKSPERGREDAAKPAKKAGSTKPGQARAPGGKQAPAKPPQGKAGGTGSAATPRPRPKRRKR